LSALACGRELYQEASDLFDRWKRLQARKRLACRVGKARPPGALVGIAPRSPRPNGSFDTTTGVEHVQEARKRWVRANSGGSIAYSFTAFVDGKMVL
jgi:hypothetical protein